MAYGDWERNKRLEKASQARYNFTMGLILIPTLFIGGPFIVVYLVSLIIKWQIMSKEFEKLTAK